MRKVSIGFDLGVASVGWSIVDIESKDIVDKGVKLYTQSNKAEDRRSARSLRRRYKRKNHRLERFQLLLEDYDIDFVNTTDNNLLEKRIIGLKDEIAINDFLNILSFFLRFRGYYPVGDDTRENPYKNNELYPCQIQKVILEENGYYRGLEFPFLISEFEKEIECIIDTQIKYSNIIDEDFKNSYMKLYKSKREFWEGPGGFKENQISPFGRCRSIEDLEKHLKNPDYNKFLYEQLIKDCSIYENEKSVPVANYYAQRFNFLNDMINISFKIEDIDPSYTNKFYYVDTSQTLLKLRLDTINEIESVFINSKTINVNNIFKKYIGIELKNIIGMRIDTSKKPVVTKFDAFKHVYYELQTNGSSSIEYIKDKNNWNKIAYYVTVIPKNNLEEKLTSERIPQDIIDVINVKACYDKFEQRYHSYSEKALKVYINLMEEHLMNSSSIERKFAKEISSDVLKNKVENYFESDKLEMSKKYIDGLVASPQVKKTLRKAITTFNQIKKEYSIEKGYQIEYISIESNKELLNSKKVAEYVSNMTGNENKRKAAAKLYSNDETKMLKHMLLEETNHQCMYCSVNLTVDTMEVEHIIPFSISADDSFANKTASCHECNHKKGNKSAYKFMQMQGDVDDFLSRVEKLKLIHEKENNLKNQTDIIKYEKKFINRNLRDTAYTTKELMNQFNIYNNALQHKGYSETFKLVSMPPKITGIIRKQYPKDREAKYHHAFDASIVAYYPLTKLGEISVMLNNDIDAFWKAGSYSEILKNIDNLVIKDQNFKSQLADISYENTRFHREIKKNYNGQLANADINKLIINGKENKKIEYVSSIYELDAKKCEVHFGEKSELCMKYNDKKTFAFLVSIYNEYKVLEYKNQDGKNIEINPFKHYCIDNNDLENIADFHPKKHGIRPMNNLNRPVITKVNYTKKVSMPYVFDKKSINKKNSTNLMLDSLSIAYTKIYKDIKTDKFVFLPIYSVCLDLKTGKINERHPYYKEVYNNLVGEKNVIPFLNNGNELILRTNDYVKVTKKDGSKIEGLVSGYDKDSSRIRLKSGHISKTKPSFRSSDLDIKIVRIYGLGIKGCNIE